MIGALNGKVFHKKNNGIILMVGDVGYLVFVPQNLLSELKLIKQEIFKKMRKSKSS